MDKTERRRPVAVDGLILLNKPCGMTSNQALQRVRRLLNARKAGHTGSLDPAATGMLPLCFGEATKVCPYLLNADKTYRVTARLGVATDTGDADGSDTGHAEVPELSSAAWHGLLQGFAGESTQVPPMYSALKRDGKRLYELARKGITVDREARSIRVHHIELLEVAGTRLVFRVRCSKGTYIRVLVEDIAKAAGTVAHTARLHREQVGDFSAADMLDMTALESLAEAGPGAIQAHLLAPDGALTALPAVSLGTVDTARFMAGQTVHCGTAITGELVRVYGGTGQFLGVGEGTGEATVAPRRVFQTAEKNP